MLTQLQATENHPYPFPRWIIWCSPPWGKTKNVESISDADCSRGGSYLLARSSVVCYIDQSITDNPCPFHYLFKWLQPRRYNLPWTVNHGPLSTRMGHYLKVHRSCVSPWTRISKEGTTMCTSNLGRSKRGHSLLEYGIRWFGCISSNSTRQLDAASVRLQWCFSSSSLRTPPSTRLRDALLHTVLRGTPIRCAAFGGKNPKSVMKALYHADKSPELGVDASVSHQQLRKYEGPLSLLKYQIILGGIYGASSRDGIAVQW